jgi:TonB family protein
MNWLNYLLQVNLYLILFYGFYRMLLRTETFFNLNRGYLVASAALAFFIPLMQSEWVRSWFVTEQISQTITTFYDPQVFYVQARQQAHTLTLGDFMAVFYIVGILIGIARFGGNLVFLGKMMKRKIVQKDSKQAFSFFNVLFVSKELKNRSTIMKHEFVHIRQLHSADVMLFELIAIFNWFNPVVYLYKSSIKHIHEFIADEVASRNEVSKADYAMLLFQEQFGVQAIPLTNNFFNQSLLKLRIKMLNKERSAQTAMMKYGLIAPLFMLMIVVSSATLASKELAKIEEKIEEVSEKDIAKVVENPSESVSETLLKDNIDLSQALIISPDLVDEVKAVSKSKRDTNMVFMAVEQPAEFEGGKDAFVKFLQENIKYPAAARRANVSGKIFVQLTVNTDGTIEDISTINSLGFGIDEEAIRVVELAKWTSGKQSGKAVRSRFIIPINFQLPKSTEVFSMVEQNAEYPGGMKAFGKFLQENLKYPVSAQKANHKGKVYIQFIVNTDGSADDFAVLKSTEDKDLDNEALRVLKLVKWIPAKQSGRIVRSRFTVPIMFELAKESNIKIDKNDKEEFPKLPAVLEFKTKDGTIINNGNIVITDKANTGLDGSKKPIVMIEGKEMNEFELKKIDPKDIEKMDVYKGETAITRYGEKAKDGAIVITLKKK